MKVLKNYLYNLSFQILAIILPIITTPYISRVLHVEGVGDYSLMTAISNYFVLFGMLGFSYYGSREIAYVRDDETTKNRVFLEINIIKMISMLVSISGYLVFVLLCVTTKQWTLYFSQIMLLFASFFDISWYYAGIEQFKKTAIRNIFVKLISVALIFLLVKEEKDIVLYAWIIALSTFCGQIVMWYDIPIKSLIKIKPDKDFVFYHLKRTICLWIPALAINVYTYLDKIMLGIYSGNQQVGLYESADKIVRISIPMVTAFSTVMFPQMANISKKNDIEQFKTYINKSLSFVIMIAMPISLGIIGISDSFVQWFFGPGYEDTAFLLLINAWLVLVIGLSCVFGNQILLALNKERPYTTAVILAAVCDIILNLILIPRLQASGALLATVISEIVCLIIMMYYTREYWCTKFLFEKAVKYGLFSLVMCIFIKIIGIWLYNPIVKTGSQIIVGALIYFLLLIVSKDKDVLYICNRLTKKNNK